MVVRKKYLLFSGHHCLVILAQAWGQGGGKGTVAKGVPQEGVQNEPKKKAWPASDTFGLVCVKRPR